MGYDNNLDCIKQEFDAEADTPEMEVDKMRQHIKNNRFFHGVPTYSCICSLFDTETMGRSVGMEGNDHLVHELVDVERFSEFIKNIVQTMGMIFKFQGRLNSTLYGSIL
ncbi:uncharacterized protein LOC132037985 isoform X2 [Lycium ferocissimum]|uniref:uncharacterized protein LOC132037985 isoform X2 n=1 Tax=Lycium ferocissimum TaxID=112874 RepID=UPI002815D606|nr:uncharacterized protein LOC132037985 isoform X2 [Lycium ferocissimum]